MASPNDEAIEALQGGRAAWAAWRAQHASESVDLRGATLQLESGAWDLSDCDLTGCTISCELMQELHVHGSDLTGAQFSPGTTVATLRVNKGTVFTRTRFEEITLQHADFTPVVLEETSFFHSTLQWVRFGGQLNDVNFGRATMSGVDFKDCTLSGCNLAAVRATDTDFDNAKLHATTGGKATTLESAAPAPMLVHRHRLRGPLAEERGVPGQQPAARHEPRARRDRAARLPDVGRCQG